MSTAAVGVAWDCPCALACSALRCLLTPVQDASQLQAELPLPLPRPAWLHPCVTPYPTLHSLSAAPPPRLPPPARKAATLARPPRAASSLTRRPASSRCAAEPAGHAMHAEPIAGALQSLANCQLASPADAMLQHTPLTPHSLSCPLPRSPPRLSSRPSAPPPRRWRRCAAPACGAWCPLASTMTSTRCGGREEYGQTCLSDAHGCVCHCIEFMRLVFCCQRITSPAGVCRCPLPASQPVQCSCRSSCSLQVVETDERVAEIHANSEQFDNKAETSFKYLQVGRGGRLSGWVAWAEEAQACRRRQVDMPQGGSCCALSRPL